MLAGGLSVESAVVMHRLLTAAGLSILRLFEGLEKTAFALEPALAGGQLVPEQCTAESIRH